MAVIPSTNIFFLVSLKIIFGKFFITKMLISPTNSHYILFSKIKYLKEPLFNVMKFQKIIKQS